jgi:hypothetical protein
MDRVTAAEETMIGHPKRGRPKKVPTKNDVTRLTLAFLETLKSSADEATFAHIEETQARVRGGDGKPATDPEGAVSDIQQK